MGQLFIPGGKTIKGPWLIGLNELEELDEIFNFIDSKIQESAILETESHFKIEHQNGLFINTDKELKEERKIKRVTLISSNNKKLIDSSIKGILKDSKIVDFKPKEIQLEIECKNNKFFLNLKRDIDGELTFDIDCFDIDCRDDIKYKLEAWIEKNKPNKAKQIWNIYAPLFIIISIVTAFVSFFNINTSEKFSLKPQYKKEIENILKTGVNKENETKTIELLAKYIIDYDSGKLKPVEIFDKNSLYIFIFSIYIFLISIVKPKTTIGIGNHKALLKFYNLYVPFILITIPVTILSLISPLIFDWIKNL